MTAEEHYTIPTGSRLIAGRVAAVGGAICTVALVYEAYTIASFVPTLVTFFVFALCLTHGRYAFDRKLTQRQVRKIDYWYLGVAAIGMLMFAVAYSGQRGATINQSREFIYHQGEMAFLLEAKTKLVRYLEEVCKDEFKKVSDRPCITGESLEEDMKPGASPELVDHWMRRLTLARSEVSKKRTVNSDEPFIKAQTAVGVQLVMLKNYIVANTPKATFDPVDEGMRLMFSIGQMVLWPFLLAFALALRIAKVTIDVFEWAK